MSLCLPISFSIKSVFERMQATRQRLTVYAFMRTCGRANGVIACAYACAQSKTYTPKTCISYSHGFRKGAQLKSSFEDRRVETRRPVVGVFAVCFGCVSVWPERGRSSRPGRVPWSQDRKNGLSHAERYQRGKKDGFIRLFFFFFIALPPPPLFFLLLSFPALFFGLMRKLFLCLGSDVHEKWNLKKQFFETFACCDPVGFVFSQLSFILFFPFLTYSTFLLSFILYFSSFTFLHSVFWDRYSR